MRASVTPMVAAVLAAATMVAVTAVTAPAASAGTLQLFGWGLNTAGQVAGTPGTVFLSPVPLPLSAAGVRQVDIGESSSATVMKDGTVDTWGDNFDGALGDGTRNDHYFPAPVPGLSGITQISVGRDVMLAVDASAVWLGRERPAALAARATPVPSDRPRCRSGLAPGDGTTTANSGDRHYHDPAIRGTPEPVPGLSGIVQVAAVRGHQLRASLRRGPVRLG